MYCTQNNGNCATCSLVSYGRDCHNNPINAKRIPVRIPGGLHREFAKKLIDDNLSAQEFFLRQIMEYVEAE